MGFRLAVLAAALIFCTASTRADDWEKQFDVAGKARVSFRADEGHFRVETWDQKRVFARVVTTGWRIADDEVQITAGQSGDHVTFDLRKPRMWWGWDGRNRKIEIEIRLPRTADLALRTSDGHVNVASLTGDLEVQTSDGHITIRDVRGSLRLRSSDGHIEATGLDGRLDAGTSDGRIQVRGRFDQLELRTSDGSIDAEVLPGSQVTTTWSVRTSDGSVTVRLAPEFNADIDAQARDGRVSTDFPITIVGDVGRSRLYGKLNQGGGTLRVRTSDGSIRISRL